MTVKELREKLAEIPDDTPVIAMGPDSGGYDWVLGPLNTFRMIRRGLMLGHIECPEDFETHDFDYEA